MERLSSSNFLLAHGEGMPSGLAWPSALVVGGYGAREWIFPHCKANRSRIPCTFGLFCSYWTLAYELPVLGGTNAKGQFSQ